jgi:colanic acid/amylovoran biosynthesis glycosyltransferase
VTLAGNSATMRQTMRQTCRDRLGGLWPAGNFAGNTKWFGQYRPGNRKLGTRKLSARRFAACRPAAEPLVAADLVAGTLSAGAEQRQRETILVYRDRLVPRSELHFLQRLYVGFERLEPIWVGRRHDNGFADLGGRSVLLGRDGAMGLIDRELFKHFGVLPGVPDLPALHPKLVHAHFGRSGALALPIARRLNLPLVVSFYGGDATKDKHYRRQWLPTIFQRRLSELQTEAALFLCVSGFIRDQLLARGFPSEKVFVQRSGVNLDTPIDPGTDPGDPGPAGYVMFAGRFVEKKGVMYLIEAVRRLEAIGRDVRLLLVGAGPLEAELRRATAALRHVEFRGWMPNNELRRWMRGALALCVPSVHAADGDAEGLPTVVIEAMAAGTPVIGSHHAGIGEAIEDERTGFLVPEQDPDAIAAAVRRLLDEPELRRRLGDNARSAAVEHFDMFKQSHRLEARLLEVIAASHR